MSGVNVRTKRKRKKINPQVFVSSMIFLFFFFRLLLPEHFTFHFGLFLVIWSWAMAAKRCLCCKRNIPRVIWDYELMVWQRPCNSYNPGVQPRNHILYGRSRNYSKLLLICLIVIVMCSVVNAIVWSLMWFPCIH